MAKKEVPLVDLPHGQMGAFFSKNCLYNLHALNPDLPQHENQTLTPVKWPGQVDAPIAPAKQK